MISGGEFEPHPGNLFCQKILSPEEFDFCQNFHLFENGLSLILENILVGAFTSKNKEEIYVRLTFNS